MADALRAEMLKLYKRPAMRVLVGLALVDTVFFVYFLGYGYYLQVRSGVVTSTASLPMILGGLLTNQVVRAVLSQSGDFVTIGLILGALVAGSEYGWGTLKTELAQGPSRLGVYLGQLLALATLLIILIPALFFLALAASVIVGALQHTPLTWPQGWQIPAGMAAAFLFLAMPSALGFMLTTMLRSSALGIGAGMAWLFVIEQALQIFGYGAPVLTTIVNWLPRANADSLAASFGQWSASIEVPPKIAHGSVAHFVAVLIAYIIAFVAIGALAFRRHDVV